MGLYVDIEKRLEHFTLNIALHCNSGSLLALTGPSGAGKTTLLRLIAGLERPDQGEIRFGDAVWNSSSPSRHLAPRHRRLAMVFQNSLLLPHRTLAGNVAFAARDAAYVQNLLERFGIAHLAKARPGEVSGGERQRAAVCQALAREPDLLLLDEPFSALDAVTRATLRGELKRIKREQALTVIHVTHDLAEAEYLADDIVALDQGRPAPAWLEEHRRTIPQSPARLCPDPAACPVLL